MMRRYFVLVLLSIVFVKACKRTNSTKDSASYHNFPNPIDTRTRKIDVQDRRAFETQAKVFASNEFLSARLNAFEQENDSVFRAIIRPENEPINPSSWYAFKLWSAKEQSISVYLEYGGYKHRYHPVYSINNEDWQKLDSTQVVCNTDSTLATLKLDIGPDTLWIAAQRIVHSGHVLDWCNQIAQRDEVGFDTIGRSAEGRSLYYLDVSRGNNEGKKTIVFLSRQHPPETTGYLAMQYFVQFILEHALLNEFLDKYRIMIYPLLNPDGVDAGHWRHNSGGVDLNRDWAYYRQPETQQVANHIFEEIKANNNQIVLGLDFHSTYHDVYYTLDNQLATSIPQFKSRWFAAMDTLIGGYHPLIKPSGIGKPITKSWFFVHFGAEGITYEVGDHTSEEFIRYKSKKSAEALIQILLDN